MKKLIHGLLPKQVRVFVQKAFWRLFTKTGFSQKQYETLQALKCKVSYNKYGGYCVPLSSGNRPAAKKILLNYVHEPLTIEYILQNCGNGDIVHAGAYFGDFLPALAQGVNSNAKIWAFEPNPENYRCAKITLEINGISNTVLTNAGLGDKRETLQIMTANEKGVALGGASQIITEVSSENTGLEPVQIVTVDEVVDSDRDVSIIHLDVEGHEKAALAGALETIRRCLPIIIIEVLPSSTLPDSQWYSDNILSLGYSKIDIIHGNSVYSCRPTR